MENEQESTAQPGIAQPIAQSALPVPSDSEIKKLNEKELKAAIMSAWKKCERLAKKEMGQLLYWLRDKLRAQGSRNDLPGRDKGFGVWVEETIEISRRTADRWADEYGLANGLMKRKPKPTSSHVTKGFEAHPDDDFHAAELRKHGKMIQMNQWVTKQDYEKHEQALQIIKKHFKITGDQQATLKGVQYAAKVISTRL
jgi:hypothetical protein